MRLSKVMREIGSGLAYRQGCGMHAPTLMLWMHQAARLGRDGKKKGYWYSGEFVMVLRLG